MTQFKIGDEVTWTSSNTKKRGKIVAIVPAGEKPPRSLVPKADGSPRDHESYVVDAVVAWRVPDSAKSKFYWPRVSLLSLRHIAAPTPTEP